jgi:hypothetical protein
MVWYWQRLVENWQEQFVRKILGWVRKEHVSFEHGQWIRLGRLVQYQFMADKLFFVSFQKIVQVNPESAWYLSKDIEVNLNICFKQKL